MPPRRRTFQRPLGHRRYRTLFIIAVEGLKTEQHYFHMLQCQQSVVHVKCLKGTKASSPPQVLKRMEDHLRRNALRSSDEAWLVVDKDQWEEEQLGQLYAWSQSRANYGFAVSNPKFEYWLLLHFEDGAGIASSRDCSDRLRRHLPDYDKGFDMRKISHGQIDDAIRRGQLRDTPACADWPRVSGVTTVYRLVERIHRPATGRTR
jgi:hypothetical protein